MRMPTKVPAGLEDSWTDDLPSCEFSGVGHAPNLVYRNTGQPYCEHSNEDQFFKFRHDDATFLYAVFDGHDGLQIAKYAAERLPAEILLDQLDEARDDEVIKDVLKKAIMTVETSFFKSIDNLLAHRTNLLMQLPENISTYEKSQRFPEIFKQLQDLNSRIAVGCSAAVCLIFRGKLYVANVGDCRVLLCRTDPSGNLRVIQLSVDHTVENEDEAFRLTQLGLPAEAIQHFRHTTRCLGDYPRKGGYKDFELLSSAVAEPVIPDPEIIGGIPTDESFKFLIVMSAGVYRNLEDATNATEPNRDLASMVGTEFCLQATIDAVAQAVIDKIARLHHDAFRAGSMQCQRRDDMTLLVRNFGFSMASRTLTAYSTARRMETAADCGTQSTISSTNQSYADSYVVDKRSKLPLDADGRIPAYVDFSEFYTKIEQLKAKQGVDVEILNQSLQSLQAERGAGGDEDWSESTSSISAAEPISD